MGSIMKKINIASSAILPSAESIENFERLLKTKLAHEYRDFLLKYGFPELVDNQFHSKEHVSVEYFFTINNEESSIETTLEIYQDRLPPHTLPIASACGGNLILLHLKSGAIYFWDHEYEVYAERPVGFEACTKLSTSFNSFLDNLEELDTVPEAKGRVMWINPEFARKFSLNHN